MHPSGTARPRFGSPEAYTPRHLAEKILSSKSALEGERKHVTVLFADLKGSPPGRAPSRAIPKGEALLAAGTANQTKLVGGPVKGPLFDFAPAIDEHLKTHLFGDIFERDNLDWQSRELATVGRLSALPGAEAQLQSHMRVSMNVGLTASQLRQLTEVLADRVDAESARRAREALARQLATPSGR